LIGERLTPEGETAMKKSLEEGRGNPIITIVEVVKHLQSN
tara:strand:- start:797 stop:916 length:120 start_codon:yes stop_codon:yes gene_type:complete